MAELLLIAAIVAAPPPNFVPRPVFRERAPCPQFIEVPVTVGVVPPWTPPAIATGHWERRCGPNGCQQVWVADAPTVDQAAARLAKGGLSDQEADRLGRIIDEHAKKVVGHEWCGSTCYMYNCKYHGAQYMDVHDDGTKAVSPIQPAGAKSGYTYQRKRRR